MSKAFTKEDADVVEAPLRRRPPLPGGVPNYVTRRGLAALRIELGSLAGSGSAPSPGGARSPAEAQGLAARRTELERRIATAVVVEAPTAPDEARFGAHVEVRGVDGTQRRVQIVGVDEADPSAGRIAFVAPLARALLGHRVGAHVTLRTPGGEDRFEITAIAYD